MDFPHTPELDALVASFEGGDYARVREGAARFAETTEDDAVRRAARTLRARVEADPLAKWLFVFTAALLVFLTVYWMLHDGIRNVEVEPPPAIEKIQ